MTNATGTIEAGSTQQARLDELTDRLGSAEFFTATTQNIPSMCIDGRTGGTRRVPNTAGGTESIMVADDLTAKRFASADGSTLGAYTNVVDFLLAHNYPVGGHTDDHAADLKSGCGANDRLAEIYAFMAQHAEVLQTISSQLGIVVSDQLRDQFANAAGARHDFSNGADLLDALRSKAGDHSVDRLRGTHKEVIAVINTVDGTTLDRDALDAEFGPEYEAFNIDVWSFANTASIITEDGIRNFVAAMVFYNLATAHVLCGPAMRVLVRS